MARLWKPGDDGGFGREILNDTAGFASPRGREGGQDLALGEPYAVVGDTVSSAIPPQRGYVRLVTDVKGGEQPASIDLYAEHSPRMLPDGYGEGWQQEDRFQRVSATVWAGGGGLAQEVRVLLDRLDDPRERDIQYEWNVLERLARPPGGRRPPVLKLVGPWLHTDLRWYLQITPPTEDEDWVWRSGSLVRARATLTVRQVVDVDLADQATGKQAAAQPGRAVDAKRGDTPKTIAKRYLGSARRAKDILKANPGIKDTEHKFRPGDTVRLPSSST